MISDQIPGGEERRDLSNSSRADDTRDDVERAVKEQITGLGQAYETLREESDSIENMYCSASSLLMKTKGSVSPGRCMTS